MTTPRQVRKNILYQIKHERNRQSGYGYDVNDADKTNGELLDAVLSYVELSKQQILTRDKSKLKTMKDKYPNGYYVDPGGERAGYTVTGPLVTQPASWSLDPKLWAPQWPQRNLIRAAALIIAELERMDKADRDYLKPVKQRRRRLRRAEPEPAQSLAVAAAQSISAPTPTVAGSSYYNVANMQGTNPPVVGGASGSGYAQTGP